MKEEYSVRDIRPVWRCYRAGAEMIDLPQALEAVRDPLVVVLGWTRDGAQMRRA